MRSPALGQAIASARDTYERVELRLRAPAQRFARSALRVDRDEGRARFGARGYARQPAPRRGREGAEGRERRGDLAQPPRRHVYHPQPAPVRVAVVRDETVRIQHRVPGHAEQPRGQSELGVHRQHRNQPLPVPAVEVPPPGDVRDAVQRAVRTPRRLDHRNVAGGAAGDPARRRQGPVGGHVRDPQLRRVPRQVGVVPADPRQPIPVGTEARRRIEVEAPMHRRRLAAAGRNRRQQVLRLGSRAAMVLGHAYHPSPGVVHRRIGIPNRDLRRDRRRRLRPVHRPAVQALVGEVRKVRHALRHRERPASVLVNPGPGAERGRRDLRHRAARGPPHRRAPAGLVRARLDPVHVAAVDGDPLEPQRPRGQHLGGDRRLPGAVGRVGWCGGHGALPRAVRTVIDRVGNCTRAQPVLYGLARLAQGKVISVSVPRVPCGPVWRQRVRAIARAGIRSRCNATTGRGCCGRRSG